MRHNALALFLMSALGACSADGVGMDQDIGADAGGGDDVVEDTNLEVDKPDASTYWLSMPMTGHGPAGGTLLYTTPGGGQFTANLGETGDFCVDVVLMKDSTNTIKFEAVNASGDYSDPVLVDVRQSGDAPGTDPSPDPEPGFSNIVSGATIDTMSVNIEEGDVAALVDGDSSGHVSIRNASTSADWMVIELNERLPIQQFHIETTPDCPMESYRILLNDDKQSGDPIVWSWAAGEYVYGAGWTIVGIVGDGTADQTITPSIGDPRAERMAIEFISSDCGPFIGAGRHNITEIEVWARGDEEPDDGEPSSGAPSCNTF
ncbi:MAG: hypothetical protein GY811_19775 [Myxococcales bacterium]|nr:hypothetical protein [Myxococcales bacterium]